MKYSESIEIEKHSELSLTERLKYILKIDHKNIYDLSFLSNYDLSNYDLSPLVERLVLLLMLALTILALYRLWAKCLGLTNILKVLLSLSLLFPGAVLIVLIITYYITACKEANNLRNNLRNNAKNNYNYIPNSVIYEK